MVSRRYLSGDKKWEREFWGHWVGVVCVGALETAGGVDMVWADIGYCLDKVRACIVNVCFWLCVVRLV